MYSKCKLRKEHLDLLWYLNNCCQMSTQFSFTSFILTDHNAISFSFLNKRNKSKEKWSFLVNVNKKKIQRLNSNFIWNENYVFLLLNVIGFFDIILCSFLLNRSLSLSLFQEAIKRCSKRKQMKKELLPWKFNFISSYASSFYSISFFC